MLFRMLITIDNLYCVMKYVEKYEPKDIYSKDIFKIKCFEQNIAQKFIVYCFDHINDDYEDILDLWILDYSIKKKMIKNNKDLILIYNTYIKILNNIKNYIQKEFK